jgi:dihydrofolate synthase/folylpolyglutamate synthase
MTEFDALLQALHSRPKSSPIPTLERIRRLMETLGNPQETLRCVHITGTNGKGSTAAFTARVLRQAGFHTGLFTSPYLVEFCERFRVDGNLMPKADFCRVARRVLEAEKQCGSVNEFEFVTAVAFCWFAEQRCDYVVLEAGMGGAYDATNLISHPVCTCITKVSLDHMALLGNTVSEIAQNKAGIVKPGVPLVTPKEQAPEALTVFETVCRQRGAELRITKSPQAANCRWDGSEMRYDGHQLTIPLPGEYQLSNAACAWEICRVLGIDQETIAAGIARTVWPGRLQLLSKHPRILTDAGHNPDGIASLCRALDTLYAGAEIHVIMTMMQDKAYAPCIEALSARATRFYACTLPLPRALGSQEVANAARGFCSCVETADSLQAALQLAMPHLNENTVLVICGSVYLAGEAISLLQNSKP